MKNILGLDLGTTSIGFAFVKESENKDEQSTIERIGVRVNPLTTDEQTDFEKGKPLTTNAGRTLKRGARRNLNRFQQRRDNLIQLLKTAKIITDTSILAEDGKDTTFQTWYLRAKSVTEKIEKEELARVLLAINKKRGYKSSRKAKNEEEGKAVDGMAIAKRLYEESLTPGELAYDFLLKNKKVLPDFYRSDLQAEFDKIWNFQKQFYPEILTEDFYKEIEGKGQRATAAIFWKTYEFNTAENKGKRDEKKLQAYKWRSEAISRRLEKEEVAYVLTEINNNLNKSSGYLGAISDRSKELYFNKETVGQNLYNQLRKNTHKRLKDQVFYRQDYLDEFEAIWTTQAKFHKELTPALKEQVRDITIFYQRKLKSQKGLISFCEFENRDIEVVKNGQKIKKTIGLRVIPKSSPLFQEFKIWQVLHNIEFKNKKSGEKLSLDQEAKDLLFRELNLKGNLSSKKILDILGYKSKEWEVNYNVIEGNKTNATLYNSFLKILEMEGYDEELFKLSNKDSINVSDLKSPAFEIKDMVKQIFEVVGIDTRVLDFDAELEGKDFENQVAYQLWHLLYSAEDDNKKYDKEDILIYGNDNISLKKQLCAKFGFKAEHAKILVNNSFIEDYGSLSAKAIRKIYPFIKESKYSEACDLAGYRHSKYSLTKEEIQNRELKSRLELLKKNSLRNPVVEKILNQMVNVVNTLIDIEREQDPNFCFDEIRIELARELKKNAKERADMTSRINSAKLRHEKIKNLLINKFGLRNPTRNDVIRYKLYEELKNNGYKDLYTNEYISPDKLFSKEIDIEHIIPKSKAFDDSFSNKTLSFRQDNLEKGNQTAIDYIESKFGQVGLEGYLNRINQLYLKGSKSKGKPEEGISKAKYLKLQKREKEIGEGFAERDLRESQYIAKKAKEMLFGISRSVVSSSGSITNRLRDDWGLINVMKELNMPKYRALGMTEIQERKFGRKVEVIIDWTKRNDHRHHAMDALTIAFTKHNHIQYLNYLNARKMDSHALHGTILSIESKETEVIEDDKGNKKRKFKEPIANFRQIAKEHLENVLISYKAKNKVVTRNKNHIKTRTGIKIKTQLTPRGQLHKETVYGSIKNEKGGLDYTIRKDVGPDLKIGKVIDKGIQRVLKERLDKYQGNVKLAFSDIDKNPIWLNQEKGISVKRVTISGVRNAEPLHYKKDHLGNFILDKNKQRIPVDFVSTGNNHHVAIYQDDKGKLQEKVVSFFEATERVNQNLPIIDKAYKQELGWDFLFTLKQNEYFIFPNEASGFDPNETDLFDPENKKLISPNLFRIQKIASRNYLFTHHLETMATTGEDLKNRKQLKGVKYSLISTPNNLIGIAKVRINHVGDIVKVGE